MEISGVEGLLTALAALFAALLGAWNAYQGVKIKKKVDDNAIELKSLRGR